MTEHNMLLNEIIDTKERSRKVNFNPRPSSRPYREYDFEGSFGRVRGKKTNPFFVTKTPLRDYTSNEDDPYFIYAREIVRYKLANHNPYAPRIYDITTLRDPKRKTEKYKIDMEKLEGFNVPEEQLRVIFEKITGETEDYIMPGDITSAIKDIIHGRKKSPDKNFQEIADLIRSIRDDMNCVVDIHLGNIMVRRTPIGPQLVIVDPLA